MLWNPRGPLSLEGDPLLLVAVATFFLSDYPLCIHFRRHRQSTKIYDLHAGCQLLLLTFFCHLRSMPFPLSSTIL
ncbi:hypothetical protein Krac_6280 [Ktedonobacter racemifer DSM 44963]|uniref:Uncharacterized protein n=1 Tax=Ktedonobacter racemifer DSM 44963 TaxID=485913 RepID=D6TYP6_KTERA|nr:hypothetical protein Krac_6280 [Ktedonobacter racemifer DSM 44963]